MNFAIDHHGKVFGRWTVLSRARNVGGRTYWNCVCECGIKKPVGSKLLVLGRSKSCGCLAKELSAGREKTHGMSNTPEYYSWILMRRRCNYKKHPYYKNYGGRGISVCKRWKDSFENFYKDMGPSLGKTIDRINNNGNYKPGNCRWATPKEQANNTRVSRKILVRGKIMTVAQASDMCGVPYGRFSSRIRMGWKIEEAMSCPKLTNQYQ